MSAVAMTSTPSTASVVSSEVKVEMGKPQRQEGAGGLYGIIAFLVLGFVGAMVALIYLGANNTEHSTSVVIDYTVVRDLHSGNPCEGKKPTSLLDGDGNAVFANKACVVDDIIAATEQSGIDVTEGYMGGLDTDVAAGLGLAGREPITTPYYQNGMCPVNVHWHLGAEHRSAGEYDEHGSGPQGSDHDDHHRQLAGAVRLGLQCHHYAQGVADHDPKFTTEYDWKHCSGMHVGNTYEVHWPHSKAGACGTPNQYQTPFYDGVFCSDAAVGAVLDGTIPVQDAVGVQAQVFTIVNDVNDEARYYWPDLMRGMIVDGDFGADIAAYTGSTTGTTRNNEICSSYSPITWQVDRKCHLISASSFDKMCADMKAQRDDMSDDLHAHGSRELVANEYAADNLQAHDNPLDTQDNAP